MTYSRPIRGVGRLAGLLLFASTVCAQQYYFQQFGHAQGLNSLSPAAFLFDPSGYLWVGTENGLFRFDGDRFQSFASNHTVRSMVRNRQSIWLRTRDGVALLRNGRVEPILLRGFDFTADAQALARGPEGSVFLATRTGLAHCTESNAALHCGLVPETGSLRVESVVNAPTGDIWFLGANELWRWHEGRVSRFGTAAGIAKRHWTALGVHSGGHVYLRSRDTLLVFDPATERAVQEIPIGDVTELRNVMLYVDRRDVAWVNTKTGLASWDGRKLRHFSTSQSGLPSNAVTAMIEDSSGSYWLATDGVGLYRWAGFRDWTGWGPGTDFPAESIRSIHRDRAGTLWIGTNAGLFRWDAAANRWVVLRGRAEKMDIRAIASSESGHLWISGSANGIARIRPDGSDWRWFGEADGLPRHPVRDIAGIGGDIVAAVKNGVFRLRPGESRFREDPLPAGQKPNIYSMSVDPTGRALVASSGLLILEKGRWRHIGPSDGLKDELVRSASKGPDGAIWISYRNPNGLTRLDERDGRFTATHFSSNDVLNSDRVSFVRHDYAGNLWIGSDRGIQALAGGRWHSWARQDGLIWDNTNSAAFLAQPDGKLWIGTSRGLSHFNPPLLPLGERSIPVSLESLRFGDTPQREFTEIQVPFDSRSMAARFTALQFDHRDDLQFEYRLDGLSDAWTRTSSTEISLSALPAGDYALHFRVRERNRDWNTRLNAATFRILPPWWATWWFRSLCVSATLAGIATVIQWRLRDGMRRRQQLEELVRSRTEELAAARDAALEASRAKAAFLANMSHEIRTPMNGVVGMNDLLLRTPLTGEQREYAGAVKESAESLLVLLNDILDFSKIEAGKLHIESVVFDLWKAVESSVELFEERASEKRLKLICHIDPSVPVFVRGDAVRIRQILLNLISNAIKFTSSGSVDVWVRDAGPGVRFEVIDTGIGIPEHAAERVFQHFSQVDDSTTRRFGGTGLGLAISRQLCQLMGGTIGYSSVPDSGSSFWFHLPLQAAPGDQAPYDALAGQSIVIFEDNPGRHASLLAVAESLRLSVVETGEHARYAFVGDVAGAPVVAAGLAAQGARVLMIGPAGALPQGCSRYDQSLHRREAFARALSAVRPEEPKPAPARAVAADLRLLVVEDNAVNQRLSERILKNLGASVAIASNGAEALQAFRRERFDLIFMDCQMPVMDGFAATQAIRAIEAAGHHTPIIAMTANAMPGDRQRCIDAGMDDYLSKPVRVDEISAAVARYAVRVSV
jgi:signal transduction histidine kinase/CheY-like chemotaxis protein/ligand-binding sensor domain-containing protein